eukprot:scaffold17.g443.t1
MGDDAADRLTGCINVWSGPRCVSTSLMYAFGQRDDCQVLDEPLYAYWLRLTGTPRPYTDLVMAAQDSDGNRVVREQLLGPRDKPLLYAKHMAKQRLGITERALEPQAVIASFSEVLEPTLGETCYPALLELYSELRALGKPPPVVLSDDLVREPEGTLRALCAALRLPYDPAMLAWPAGPKPCDGPWGPWWYASTHRTTGFQRQVSFRAEGEEGRPQQGASDGGGGGERQPRPLPPHLRPLLEECRPLWEALRRRALRPLPPDGGGGGEGPPGGPIRQQKQHGTHAYAADPRNADILVGMRDGVTGRFDLVWRPEAKVSVLDSGFMLGDGVWEGIRLHRGVLLFAQEHLDRLFEGAKAIDMDIGMSRQALARLVYDTVDANGMREDVHIRRGPCVFVGGMGWDGSW